MAIRLFDPRIDLPALPAVCMAEERGARGCGDPEAVIIVYLEYIIIILASDVPPIP